MRLGKVRGGAGRFRAPAESSARPGQLPRGLGKFAASLLRPRCEERGATAEITDQHSTAGRTPSRVGITRTVSPGRSVAVRGYPAGVTKSHINFFPASQKQMTEYLRTNTLLPSDCSISAKSDQRK